MTHPVEVYRYLEDNLGLTMVAVKRLAPVRVTIPAEKIEASALVFYAVAEGVPPHKRLEIGEPANQKFTVRVSLWNRNHSRSEVEVGREVFAVDRELACLPQELAEQVAEVTTQDTIRQMQQNMFMQAMGNAATQSGAERKMQEEAAMIFELEADKRVAELRSNREALLREKKDRDLRDQQSRKEQEAKEEAHVQEMAKQQKQEQQASPGKRLREDEPRDAKKMLRVYLVPEARETMIAIEDTQLPDTDPYDPTLIDLAGYIIQNDEMTQTAGCSVESIREWSDANDKADRVPLVMRITVKSETSKEKKYTIPDNQHTATKQCLSNIYALQAKDPTLIITVTTKVMSTQKTPKDNHPDWLYVPTETEEDHWTSPNPNKQARTRTADSVAPRQLFNNSETPAAHGNPLCANTRPRPEPADDQVSKANATTADNPDRNSCRTSIWPAQSTPTRDRSRTRTENTCQNWGNSSRQQQPRQTRTSARRSSNRSREQRSPSKPTPASSRSPRTPGSRASAPSGKPQRGSRPSSKSAPCKNEKQRTPTQEKPRERPKTTESLSTEQETNQMNNKSSESNKTHREESLFTFINSKERSQLRPPTSLAVNKQRIEGPRGAEKIGRSTERKAEKVNQCEANLIPRGNPGGDHREVTKREIQRTGPNPNSRNA
jgi:hypothetical protein